MVSRRPLRRLRTTAGRDRRRYRSATYTTRSVPFGPVFDYFLVPCTELINLLLQSVTASGPVYAGFSHGSA